MQTITTIGLDIAKSVFQVHGMDAGGQVIVRRQLKRRYVLTFFRKLSPCLVGIEACGSAHHWSRELQALGHTVRLMPPAYVKPYLKRQKNDATDAEAICEAVTRTNMRFVSTERCTTSTRTGNDICQYRKERSTGTITASIPPSAGFLPASVERLLLARLRHADGL
jgi:transposase